MSETETGSIKMIDARGFGFIRRGPGPDAFFHVSESAFPSAEFDERLVELDVEFRMTTDARSGRVKAVDVRPAR